MRSRLIPLLLAAGLLAGGVVALVAASRADARPGPPAPEHAAVSPPPAWIETEHGDAWLAFSTYCWTRGGTGICVDYINPASRTDLPRVRVRRGEVVRIHLGVVPVDVTVSIGSRPVTAPRSRILEIRVTRPGLLVVTLLHARGDASYAARLVAR